MIIGRTANLTEEKPGRAPCQYRGICARGCSYGAYFSTQSSTLPAARQTGNLTLLTDSLVDRIDYDAATGRATGVRIIDTKTRKRVVHTAKIIFLCAGAVNSVSVLLRSASESFPQGLGNKSGVLGRYFMDHAMAMAVMAKIPGFDDHTYFGVRPNGIIIPRFMNVFSKDPELLRGYSYQGMAYRSGWPRGGVEAGIGKDFKASLRRPGDWHFLLATFAECIPRAENRITLDPAHLDPFGIQQTRIEFTYGENERKLLEHALTEAKAMLTLAKAEIIAATADPGPGGTAIHEMGGARMGRDPGSSVLNGFNQVHDVRNLFVTDGAAMGSSACQNPSLTYMALTARACDTAVSQLKAGIL
jgi:choline dehydrogenase-like flavoprotein